jgi:hypothetical protein
MADAQPPPKKLKVDAFAAMLKKRHDREQKEEAEAREKASKPLPAPKPRGPAPKDLKQRPKTWDPLGGAVDTTNTSHPMGQYRGAWIGVEESDPDAEPLPAQRRPTGRPPAGYRWDPCAGPVVPCQGHAAGVYQGKYVNDDDTHSSSDEEQDAQEVEMVGSRSRATMSAPAVKQRGPYVYAPGRHPGVIMKQLHAAFREKLVEDARAAGFEFGNCETCNDPVIVGWNSTLSYKILTKRFKGQKLVSRDGGRLCRTCYSRARAAGDLPEKKNSKRMQILATEVREKLFAAESSDDEEQPEDQDRLQPITMKTRSMPVGSSLPTFEQSVAKERKRKRRERTAVQLTRVLLSTGAVADAAEEFKAQVKKTRGAARKAAELGA